MERLKHKTILVTGGAGFIGSHLCDRLIKLEAKVICFDNFFTGKKENILHLLENKNFTLIKGDINKFEDIEQVFKKFNIDYIFHYAAILGVKRVIENPLLVLDDIYGIQHILRLAKEHKIKKVIFSSSSEVYGFSTNLPLKEDDGEEMANNSSDYAHLYALVKLMGEKIMKMYNNIYNVPTCSLRFFNVFGPNQESSSYGFVAGVFIKQVINDKSPTVFGNGYQTRDFIFIDDNIRIAIKALLSPDSNGEVINVGVGRQTTIIDLAERIIRISGKNLKPEFVDMKERKNEIKYRSPDITKMRKILNETIEDKFEENLKITYNWYLKNNA